MPIREIQLETIIKIILKITGEFQLGQRIS